MIERAAPLISSASVLIIDDEIGMRNFLKKILQPHCALVEEAATASEATAKLDETRFDIVILDNLMPNQTGVEWLLEQRQIGFFGEAIVITAYADLETVIAALRAGAIDFLLKPFRANQILSAVVKSLDRTALRRENTLLRHELSLGANTLRSINMLAGNSVEITQVKDVIHRCAMLDSNVLIKGETALEKKSLHACYTRVSKIRQSICTRCMCGLSR